MRTALTPCATSAPAHAEPRRPRPSGWSASYPLPFPALGECGSARSTGPARAASVSGRRPIAEGRCEVVVREQDGLHEYTLPDGFTFNVNGQKVGVDQLPPGTTVGALITDKVLTRNVALTRVASATLMQVAPGGIVLKTADGELESYERQGRRRERHLLRAGWQRGPGVTSVRVGHE